MKFALNKGVEERLCTAFDWKCALVNQQKQNQSTFCAETETFKARYR
jgi:hypothetical protein